jgi:hypothetical protein
MRHADGGCPYASLMQSGVACIYGTTAVSLGRLKIPHPRAVPEQMYGIPLTFPLGTSTSHSYVPYIRMKTAIGNETSLTLRIEEESR